MNLSFQLKTTKTDAQGKSPIYARITIQGLRTEFSLKRSVETSRRIPNAGVVKGSNAECKSVNAFLGTVRLKLNEHYLHLLEAGKNITPEVGF